MPFPDPSDISGLEYVLHATPYARLTGAGANSYELRHALFGLPIVATGNNISTISSSFIVTILEPYIATLEYVLDGVPFGRIADPSINTFGLDYVLDGQPFVITESSTNSQTVEFDETVLIVDSVSSNFNGDTLSILDAFTFNVTIEFDEGVGVADATVTSNVSPVVDFSLNFSTLISVAAVIDQNHSTVIQVPEYFDGYYTTDIGVQEDYLLPFTNVTAPGNIFEPTIILNGAYLVQNPSTDPGGDTSGTSLYINIKNAGLTNISACDLEGYSFTLDYGGGSFSIIAAEQMGALGDTIDLYGFLGTITTTGQVLSNSQAGFSHRGIFGVPKLNRFFQYLMSANTTMMPLLSNPSFIVNNSDVWQTARSIALAIASSTGVSLQWLAHDAIVTDFRLEDNMTALDALSSMASRVGAQLRWNGNNKYIVALPDQFFGYWTPPSCSLISSEGLSNENYLDLTTGLYGINPSVLTAFNNSFNTGERSLVPDPQPNGSAPQVQQVAKVSKNITDEDPPLIFDLPFDYDRVYIQILVAPNADTGGSNQVSIQNFITTDPKEWFEFSVLGFANEYVFMSNVGGAFIPQVKADHKLMPSPNTAIENSNFVLTISCTRKQINPSPPLNNAQQQAAQGPSQERYRFIKVYSGTFSCVFFGSIPIPGMWASATIPNVRLRRPNSLGGYDIITIGDVLVEGIIESVNFSFPGFITVSVAKYKRLRYSEIPRIDYGHQ